MPGKNEETAAPIVDGMQVQVDAEKVIASQARRMSALQTELSIKDAVIEQLQEQIAKMQEAIDAAAAQPRHNGRVTTPPTKKGKR
jgi:uncharacterized coiled-coil protein SlyX